MAGALPPAHRLLGVTKDIADRQCTVLAKILKVSTTFEFGKPNNGVLNCPVQRLHKDLTSHTHIEGGRGRPPAICARVTSADGRHPCWIVRYGRYSPIVPVYVRQPNNTGTVLPATGTNYSARTPLRWLIPSVPSATLQALKRAADTSRPALSRHRYCCRPMDPCHGTITGDHSKQDHILLIKNCEYIGFCVDHRSYLLR